MNRELKMQNIIERLTNATDREIGIIEAFTHGLGIVAASDSEVRDRAVLMAATAQEMYQMPLERLRMLYVTAKVWADHTANDEAEQYGKH